MFSSRLRLRSLILASNLLFLFLALAASIYATYLVKRNVLIDDVLKTNQSEAGKLARLTDDYLRRGRELLELVANDLSERELEPQPMRQMVMRLDRVNDLFQSLSVLNAQGVVVADSALTGESISSGLPMMADLGRAPMISEPYRASASGRWQVTLSQPIFSEDQQLNGYLVGTIYLHAPNAVRTILGAPKELSAGYAYLVDRSGVVIYHPEAEREGERAINAAVDAVKRGEHGALRFTNRRGVDMLGGFAPVSSTGWGIIVQKPAVSVLARVDEVMQRTFWYVLPVIALLVAAIVFFSNLITRPLRQLAEAASRIEDRDVGSRLRHIRSWYREAADLRRGLLRGVSALDHSIGRLRRESGSDPLTGVLNRRGLALALEGLREQGIPLSVVMFDIDYFKRINDQHGHLVGDRVVRDVSKVVQEQVRAGDYVARLGGDEFLVVLPQTEVESAAAFAERLRNTVAHALLDSGTPVTLSLGVARIRGHDADTDSLLQAADRALYHAKGRGRNRVSVMTPGGIVDGYELMASSPLG
ncbi:GGDEF domain-containing protein [Bordetella trematum]|uniref:GGDEF domain-containing protein n=1 Tax=Bordetella trematum TaxID=123899 RepID=UPI000D88FBBA|nr:sensor domain-containing diguanylate cyclase [Bordetella trematum]SPU49947.1 signaling protein [Bordetella trematum]VDH07688.1 Diguanylate cyclase DosC [Bordetella trematum]